MQRPAFQSSFAAGSGYLFNLLEHFFLAVVKWRLKKMIFSFYYFMLNLLEKPRLQFSSVRKMSLRSEDKMTSDMGWCCKFLRDRLPIYNFFLSGCIIYTLTFNSWICLPFWTFFPREEGGALWYLFGHKILPNSLEQNCWCQIFFLDDKVFLHCD